MRWVYYSVALLATLVACWLWLFIFSQGRAGPVPVPAPAVLPVPPLLRPASAVSIDASLSERFFCVAGFVARQTGNSVETLLVGNRPVPCRENRQ